MSVLTVLLFVAVDRVSAGCEHGHVRHGDSNAGRHVRELPGPRRRLAQTK